MSLIGMENIVVHEVHAEGLRRVYNILIPAVVIEGLFGAALQKKASETSLAGFRKGKATVGVVKKAYDVDAILQQITVDKALSSLTRFLLEGNIGVSSNPRVISLNLEEYKSDKKDASCSIEIELMPKTPLIEPQSVEVNFYVVDISDEDIDKDIETLIKESSRYVKEDSADYAVKDGDVVHIDFTGKVAGKSFKGGTAKDFKVLVGGNKLVSEIEAALVGMHVGEEKDVDVMFDSAYHDKDLAGKHAKFRLHLNSVEKKVTLGSVEDLVSYWNCENVEALRQKVKENLQVATKKIARDISARDFSAKLDSLYVFDVPQSMVQKEKDTIHEYYKQNPNQISKLNDKLDLAEARVKFGMMFAKFAKTHNITISAEEINDRVMSMVYGNADYASYMVDLLKKNPIMLQSINADILENKVLDVLLSKVKSVEKNVTLDELLKIANGKA